MSGKGQGGRDAPGGPAVLAWIVTALIWGGCAGTLPREEITVAGSDVMVILSHGWAEGFMKGNPQTSIKVKGGGSSSGIAALIQGRLDICQSSRPFTEEESQAYMRRHGARPREIAVARDGIVIYVNKDNGIGALSLAQLRGLFAGRLVDWRGLGGELGRVVLFAPLADSGTSRQFKAAVMGKEALAPGVRRMAGTAEVIAAVSEEEGGLGFGGLGYADDARLLPVRPRAGKPAVQPSLESFGDGTYPIARKLFYYTAPEPRAPVASFLEWVASQAGESRAREAGYCPVEIILSPQPAAGR